MTEEYRLDRPVALTCPECGGAVASEHTGTLLQFRCHIGHVLTAETMLAGQFAVLEAKLAACLVALNERAELCRQMREAGHAQGHDTGSLETAEREALERAELIRDLLQSEWAQTSRAYVKHAKGFISTPRPGSA
jgi:two-component system chemotaxis response regulator CheB